MAVRTYRILACILPLQCAAMLGWAWVATRPPALAPNQQADRIIVSKSQHRLTLYAHGTVLRSYSVALGRAAGRKVHAGDHRTPEGHYFINGHNPHSAFHWALHLSYPNADDRSVAATAHADPGGQIMIHGLPNGLKLLGPLAHAVDWTDGCIAIGNAEMGEIYRLVPNGTLIEILR